MPQVGTLLALKELFNRRRTVTVGPVVLTPADIGTTILCNVAGGTTVTLPRIAGVAASGISALGAGASIAIVVVQGPVSVAVPAGSPDTRNIGQAFPVALADPNDWGIFVSDGGAVSPSDWLVILGL
jgi:hypothetical protein